VLVPRDLHICNACRADVVNPQWAAPFDEGHWEMSLRCGACGHTRHVVIPNPDAERYETDLDRGWNEIGREVARLEREQMCEWTEAFASALEHDLIRADDFARA
jgi:hypothetical protein